MKPKFLLIIIIIIVALLIGGVYLLAQTQEVEKPLQFLGENSFNLSLTTEDGIDLAATYYPSPLSVEDRGVVLVHDSGQDRYQWVDFAQQLRDENYEVLIFDLRGHGASEGDHTSYKEKAWRRMFMDVQAATEYLHSLNADMKVGLVGVGSGAFTAMQTTKQSQNISALVAVEPPQEFQGLKAEKYPPLYNNPFYLVSTEDKRYLLDSSASEIKDFHKIENAEYTLSEYHQTIINWLKGNLSSSN